MLAFAESDSAQCEPILDFQKFDFLTPSSFSLRGVTHFANIFAKTNVEVTCLSGAQMGFINKKNCPKFLCDTATLTCFSFFSVSVFANIDLA